MGLWAAFRGSPFPRAVKIKAALFVGLSDEKLRKKERKKEIKKERTKERRKATEMEREKNRKKGRKREEKDMENDEGKNRWWKERKQMAP